MGEFELDWSGSGLGRVKGYCEGGNEHFDTTKMGEISWIAQQTLASKNGTAQWIYVVD